MDANEPKWKQKQKWILQTTDPLNDDPLQPRSKQSHPHHVVAIVVVGDDGDPDGTYLETLQRGKRILCLEIGSVVRIAGRHGFADVLGRQR